MTSFGDAVRRLRHSRGFSQKELGTAAGLSQSYIAMIESRERAWNPKRQVVQAIAAALGVTEAALLERSGLPATDEPAPVVTVESAIIADPVLDVDEKRVLCNLYRVMTRGR